MRPIANVGRPEARTRVATDTTTRMTEEPTLLQRVAQGDASAVNAVVQRYGGLVWSIARRLSPGAEDAEDAVQEVFIDVWKNASRFDPALGSETTFISMICRRRCIDRLRARGRRPQPEALPVVDLPSQTDEQREIEIRDEAASVSRYLDELRPAQRKVLELSIYRGLSHSSISEQLEMPLGTVKTHVRRALIRIRELIAQDSTRAEVSHG